MLFRSLEILTQRVEYVVRFDDSAYQDLESKELHILAYHWDEQILWSGQNDGSLNDNQQRYKLVTQFAAPLDDQRRACTRNDNCSGCRKACYNSPLTAAEIVESCRNRLQNWTAVSQARADTW